MIFCPQFNLHPTSSCSQSHNTESTFLFWWWACFIFFIFYSDALYFHFWRTLKIPLRRAHPLFESQGAPDVVQNLLCPISLSSRRDSSKATAKPKILGRSQVQPSSLFAPQVRFPDSHALFDHLFTQVPPRHSDGHAASPSALCSSVKTGGGGEARR